MRIRHTRILLVVSPTFPSAHSAKTYKKLKLASIKALLTLYVDRLRLSHHFYSTRKLNILTRNITLKYPKYLVLNAKMRRIRIAFAFTFHKAVAFASQSHSNFTKPSHSHRIRIWRRMRIYIPDLNWSSALGSGPRKAAKSFEKLRRLLNASKGCERLLKAAIAA